MEETKKELQNLWQEVINSDDEIDIREEENFFLETRADYEFEDIDQLINDYMFF